MNEIQRAQAVFLLKSSLTGDITSPETAANIQQVVGSDRPSDEKNALLYMIFKGLEVSRNARLFIRPDGTRAEILEALGNIPFTSAKEIDQFLTRFLETLPKHGNEWREWANAAHPVDIQTMVQKLLDGQPFEMARSLPPRLTPDVMDLYYRYKAIAKPGPKPYKPDTFVAEAMLQHQQRWESMWNLVFGLCRMLEPDEWPLHVEVVMTDRHQYPYPTYADLGEILVNMAGQGAISDAGLLRMCAIISKLTTHGIHEEDFVMALSDAFPHRADDIQQVLAELQADPLLSVRKRGEEAEE